MSLNSIVTVPAGSSPTPQLLPARKQLVPAGTQVIRLDVTGDGPAADVVAAVLAAAPDVAVLAACAAVRLFAQQADMVRPGFTLTEGRAARG
jgi:hypothetical protein